MAALVDLRFCKKDPNMEARLDKLPWPSKKRVAWMVASKVRSKVALPSSLAPKVALLAQREALMAGTMVAKDAATSAATLARTQEVSSVRAM